uniref:Uncharacterized protein n=1 Tax=Branchiostoma floridae TaxID=7739 RepID=C3ZQ87_BRAFL|eukprot:XP_002589269.1 hypothetical protein BRAFLDRAFT_130073 [Branchiostoma floridae]
MEMPFVWLGGCLYTLLLYFTLSASSELDVPGSSPYTVHLENSTSVGKAVFDAWLGPGWRYRWVPGPGTHQARRFFSLDPVTGVLSVSRELDCSRLYHNPFTAHIGARTAKIASKHASGRKSASLLSEPRHEEVFVWTDLDAESPGRTLDSVISRTHEDVDYTSIPVELWIHGENCRFRHRKNLNQALQSLGVQTVHLHRHANHHANNAVQNGAATNLCLSENQLLFSPADYVPMNILQSCQVSYDILNSSLSLGHTGFGIVTNEALCTDEDNPSITVQVMLDLVCDVGSVPMSSQMLLHVMLGRRVQPDFVPVRTLHHMFKFRRKRSSNSFPSFGPSPAFVVQVPENEDPGYVVTLVTATDPDPGEAGRLQYSMVALQNSRSQDLFSIDPASGEVTTQEVLDREDMNRHFFRVTARDNGSPPRSATATLQIDILDMNDHDPEFEENSYREAVLEGIEIGSNVLTVRATDQDIGPNSDIRYSIINPSGTNTAFQISRRDGVITTTEALDRETTASYRLEVRASDQGTPPRTSDVVVTITVLDENDNEPQFEQQSYAKDVPENVRPDTVIQTVAATDPDEGTNSQIRYSLIGGNSQGHFTIDSATGDISVITNLDFESTPRYRLIVKAQDSGRPSMWSSVVLTVSVIDVNDHDPQFVSTPFETSVFEDVRVGFSVIHIQAIDADSGSNAELTYSLANVPARMPFEIDGDTGWIVTNAELDREAHAIYDFNVQAADQGSPARTAAARVSINILDVNDNAPVFNPKVYYINVPEDANPGTSVLTVTANDADEVGTVSYQITGGNVRNRFSITSQNGLGTISVALPLDYKQETRFVLTVQATDRMLSDDAQVYINITDANTHRPVFQQSPYSVYVDEDVPIGTTILVVSATDGDEGENARISYSMDILNAFEIEPSTGAIKTKQRLDHEAQASFAVSVTATDHGVPSKFDESYVDIIVNDVNDNAPVFLLESYSGSVREDCSRGTSVTQISATDADSGTNGQIRYTFTGGDNGEDAFVIDERSGIIRTDKRLDRELIPVYNLVAYAEDQGQPEQKTPVDIIVTIEDVNDNAPQFPSDTIDIYVPENRVVGSVVARITANDPDEGQNAEVMYYITKGNNPELFQLDIFSGELVTLIDLDYEARNFYEITVQARSMPLFSEAIVNIHIQDENDNIPVLQDFEIVFNNYRNHFPTDYIGRIPAFDPDVSDRLAYSFTFGNNANLLHLNQSTGEIKLSPQLDSDRAFEAQLGVSVTDGINKVSAQCLLKVSVVTDEMLSNSITVRLGNMTQELFLSPRYNRFVEGLAAILQTPQDHIHIFNVRDDVDVSHKILNVSFSARDPTQIRTVYYTPQYLRERVYLRRTLLNQLTAATVLPFDDNVCLIEPCPNYERCVSVLKFDSTAPFVTSDTVLFRAIHPINGLRCKCPLGFTGSYCETEINLCYSSPCGGNGNCMRKEGGYTCVCNEDYAGDNCEINAREGRCTDYVCKNGGVCTNLLVGGFRCNCGMQGNHVTDFCEVSTRSFPPRSFLTFPALQQRFRMQLSLTFASQNRNALLLYNGRYNVKHDYLALEIVDGQIKFSFSTGQETTVVQPHVPGGVNDGQWHTVTINYMNKPCSADEPCSNIPYGPSDRKVATVSIDDCDTAIAVKYGSVIGNYSCAAQGVQLSGKKSLDLTGPMIMGGLPSLEEQFPVKNRDYVGCIKDFYIDNKFVDLASYMSNNGTTAGCPERQQFCTSNPCRNGGTCENDWDRFYCSCPTGYGGPTCNRQMRAPKRYSGNSVMDYSVSNLPVISLPWYNGLMFRTRQANGLMMRINIGDFNVINLELVNGFLQYRFTLETITMTNRRVNDGDWHAVEVRWTDSGELVVDLDYGGSVNSTTIADWISQLRIRKVNVGGLKQGAGNNIVVENGFRGCIQGVTLGGARDQLDPNTATSHNVEDNCVVDDLCDSSPCPANSFCNDEWESYSCQCDIGYVGRGCVSACELNPCEHGSTCVAMPSASHGYSCECTDLYQEHHYQPKDSEVCYPCDCYMEGSNSMDCDQETGQCSCGNGVIGRRCDSCHNPFAEVTGRSCEVIYDGCPKSYAEGKWWPQTRFGLTSREECPSGASGIAERQCSEETGWLPPNMFNCTSRNFIPLKTALEGLRGKLSSEQAQNIAQDLRNATVDTPDLYGNDVNISHHNGAGAWTTRGCRLMERNLTHIKCGCDHLSSFAILMDDSPSEFGLNRPVALMVVTYVGIGISLVLLVAAFLTFMCLKNLQSNTNTIHKNLVASIFIAELIFLVGVNATHNQLMCTLVAILLHYSFLTAFAWMFLEALHIYRMLTEIRNINQGHMRFYYSIGWGAPAIIVGLAFGVKPESYGNRDFCWLQVNDRLFWTLAGPILLVVLINLFVFIFAVRRLLRMARKDPEHQSLKSGLMATAILIPMLGTTWVFGVLAVNQDLETFHYMFAILTCMQGLFVFLFHCIFNPSVRQGWSRCWGRCRGKKGTYEDSVTTRTTLMSRSALAYNNTSSADGGLHRINIGTSTNSTGSRSTSKTSTSQLWRTDGMLRTGYNPNDYKPNHPMFLDGKVNKGGEEGDSDSDSDMSLNDPDEELSLASSHSSDDEEYDGQPNWEKTIKLSEVVMEDAPKSLRPILKSPKSSRSSRSRSSKSSRERRERQMSDEGSESNSDSSAAKELKQILKKPGSRKGIAKSASGNFYSSSSSSDDSESEYEFLQKDPKDATQKHLKPPVHGPLHSTPKDPVPVNRVPREKPPLMPKPKPKWPGEPLSASERESLGSLDRLKVEPKVNGDKPSPPVSQHGGSIHGSQPDVVRIQPVPVKWRMGHNLSLSRSLQT